MNGQLGMKHTFLKLRGGDFSVNEGMNDFQPVCSPAGYLLVLVLEDKNRKNTTASAMGIHRS